MAWVVNVSLCFVTWFVTWLYLSSKHALEINALKLSLEIQTKLTEWMERQAYKAAGVDVQPPKSDQTPALND